MTAPTCTRFSWCTVSQSEHDFEVSQGVAQIHGRCVAGFVDYEAAGITVGVAVERHEEPDGRLHDIIWVENDQVAVVDAEAFARAILEAAERLT